MNSYLKTKIDEDGIDHKKLSKKCGWSNYMIRFLAKERGSVNPWQAIKIERESSKLGDSLLIEDLLPNLASDLNSIGWVRLKKQEKK